MMYVDFSAGNKDYKLRLSIRNTITLERQLGCNPLVIFGDGDKLPTVTTMVQILHASLQQYHHNIGINEAQDIFETWLDDGHAITDFIQVIVDIYKVSGIIRSDEEKN